MIYPDSRHIGILDFREKSKGQFGDKEISWFVAACNQFLQNDLKKIYPEDPVWTVEHYSSIAHIDLVEVWPMGLFDDDGLPDALGHHYTQWGLIGAGIDCLNRSLDEILSTILHELEMCFNPYLVEWRTLPDGRKTPREAGDPPQWDPYDFAVHQRFGGVQQTRSFQVQNMVGARYWGELPGEKSVPFDLKRTVSHAHQWPIPGYRVVKDGTKTYNEFGAASGVRMGARKYGPLSRTWHLLKNAPETGFGKTGQGVDTWSVKHGGRAHFGTTPQGAMKSFRKSLVTPK